MRYLIWQRAQQEGLCLELNPEWVEDYWGIWSVGLALCPVLCKARKPGSISTARWPDLNFFLMLICIFWCTHDCTFDKETLVALVHSTLLDLLRYWEFPLENQAVTFLYRTFYLVYISNLFSVCLLGLVLFSLVIYYIIVCFRFILDF